MSIFYHIDRVNWFDNKDISNAFHLQISDDLCTNDEEILQLHEMFEGGKLSQHGRNYLRFDNKPIWWRLWDKPPTKPKVDVFGEGAVELCFEFYRRAFYPNIPSRYTSLFACETVEDAIQFRNGFFRKPKASIWKVSGSSYFKADMNLITLNAAPLQVMKNANSYWSGLGSPNPSWEILLSYPIKFIEKVVE